MGKTNKIIMFNNKCLKDCHKNHLKDLNSKKYKDSVKNKKN